jgi:hypothetical protein
MEWWTWLLIALGVTLVLYAAFVCSLVTSCVQAASRSYASSGRDPSVHLL